MQTLVYILLGIPRLFHWYYKRPVEVYTVFGPLILCLSVYFNTICIIFPQPMTPGNVVGIILWIMLISGFLTFLLNFILMICVVGPVCARWGSDYGERYQRDEHEMLNPFMSWKDLFMLHVDTVWSLMLLVMYDLPRWIVEDVLKAKTKPA